MKFIYLDESGTGTEPIAVMVGIIVDAARMRKAKQDWNFYYGKLQGLTKKPVEEFKGSQYFRGTGPWRGTDSNQRQGVLNEIVDWFSRNSHKMICTAVEQVRFDDNKSKLEKYPELKNVWSALAVHTALAIQKHFQGAKPKGKNKRKVDPKGHCLLVFDDQKWHGSEFIGPRHFPGVELSLSADIDNDTWHNNESATTQSLRKRL